MKPIIIAAVFLVLCSCKHTGAGDHISPKVMKKILVDIHTAETYCTMAKDSLHRVAGTKNLDSLSLYYKEIFAHYHITEAQFAASMDWYKNHPDDMDTVYNEMIPVVTGMQAALPKR